MRIPIIFAIAIAATCAASGDEQKATPDTVKNYETFLTTLDPTKPPSISAAVGKYLMDFPLRPIAERDQACILFLRFFSGCRPKDTRPEDAPGRNTPDILTNLEFKYDIQRFGLRVGAGNMCLSFFPLPGFVQHIFGPHVSEPLQRYMENREREVYGVVAVDAGLALNLTDLAERIGRWDTYMQDFPTSPLFTDAKVMNIEYQFWLLHGSDNSHLFDRSKTPEHPRLKKEYLDVYHVYLDNYPDTPTADLIRDFLARLEKDGFEEGPDCIEFENKICGNTDLIKNEQLLPELSSLPYVLAGEPIVSNVKPAEAKNENSNNPSRPNPAYLYSRYLEPLDNENPQSPLMAAGKYLLDIPTAEPREREEALFGFVTFYAKCCDAVADHVRQELEKIAPGKSKDFEELARHPELTADFERLGLHVQQHGSAWGITPAKYFLTDHLTAHALEKTDNYYKLYDLEIDQPYLKDGALTITPQELAARLGRWELYNEQYGPHSSRMYPIYLRLFLFGADKTPIISSGQPSTDFIHAYEYYVRAYPRTATARMLNEFLESLKAGETPQASLAKIQHRAIHLVPDITSLQPRNVKGYQGFWEN